MPATTRRTRLSDAQLEELLALARDVDSVELKLTVPDSERRSTVTALGMDPLEAQIRQVFFFDTPELALNQHGVVVRARRVQGRGDTVVKLRPIVPGELPPSVRKAQNMVVEVDALPGGYVCSASVKGAPASPQVHQVAAGDLAIRKLYFKEQRAFYAAHAPEGVGLYDLSASTCTASSTPRPRPPSTTSPATSRPRPVHNSSPVRRSLSPTVRLRNPPNLDQLQAEQPGPDQDPEQCGLVGQAAT